MESLELQSLDDDALARKALAGDQDALRTLLERAAPVATRVAYAISGSREDALDAAQTALLKIATGLSTEWSGHSFRGWLIFCAHNTAVDQCRQQANRRRRENVFGATQHQKEPAMPDRTAEQEETLAALRHELQNLPAETAQIVSLHHLHGLSVAEVAQQAGVSVDACKMRLSRGRELLRERLVRRGVSLASVPLLIALFDSVLHSSTAWAAELPASTTAQIAQQALQAGAAGCVATAPSAAGTALKNATRSNAAVGLARSPRAPQLSRLALAAGVAALGILAMLLLTTPWQSPPSAAFTPGPISRSTPPTAPEPAARTAAQAATETNPVTGVPQSPVNPNVANTTTAASRAADTLAGGDLLGPALDWLVRVQEADGHFDGHKFGALTGQDVAVTSLALLALGGQGGYASNNDKYKTAVTQCITWLQEQRGGDTTQLALRTLALSEQFGTANCPRKAAQAAVDELAGRQSVTGEWLDEAAIGTYSRATAPTTWAVFALFCAKSFDLSVPPETLQRMTEVLATERDEIRANGGSKAGAFMAAGLGVQRLAVGQENKGAEFDELATLLPRLRPAYPVEGIGDEVIVWYQGTLLFFDKGDTTFKEWTDALTEALTRSQLKEGDLAGSWDFRQGSDPFRWGRVGATALSALALDVRYRYLKSTANTDAPAKAGDPAP